MVELILYTKDACSLCDIVKGELEVLRPTYPHQLKEIDITTDKELFSRYRFSIPVLHFNPDQLPESGPKLRAPIDRTDLIRAFQATGGLRQHER